MKTRIIIAFLLLFIAGCGEKEKKDEQKEQISPIPSERPQAEFRENLNRNFTLEFDNNQSMHLKRGFIRGKTGLEIEKPDNYVFSFFTSDCDACNVQNEILDKFDKSGAIKAVGILLDANSSESAIDYASKTGTNFPISFGADNAFFVKIMGGIEKIPFMIFVDKNGEIQNDYVGLIPEEILINEIERLF